MHLGHLTSRSQTTLQAYSCSLASCHSFRDPRHSPNTGAFHSCREQTEKNLTPFNKLYKITQADGTMWSLNTPAAPETLLPLLPGTGPSLVPSPPPRQHRLCAPRAATALVRFSYSILPRYVLSYFLCVYFTSSRAAAEPSLLSPRMWRSSWRSY